MSVQNWIQMGQEEYEFHEFFRMNEDDFKHIDLKNNHVAAAKNGGPIAATQNKFLSKSVQVLDNIFTKNKIGFFANNGKAINSVLFKPEANIVGFEFIQDELLLVVLENWNYFIVQPNPGKNQIKSYTIPQKNSQTKIKLAKSYENGFVFQTEINTFYFIDSVYEPYKCKQFFDPDLSKKQDIIKHWVIIPRAYTLSEKLELQITHHTAGIINLVEDEEFQIHYNRQYAKNFEQQSLPHLDNIVMIAPSPDYEQIVYLSQVQKGQTIQWICSVMASNFINETIYQQEVPKLEQVLIPECHNMKFLQPQQIIWCGKNCIIINTQLEFKIINQYLVRSEKNSRVKGKILVQEIDGVRIITNRKQEILRQIPESYISIFQELSTEPGAMLLDQYQQLEEKQPIDYEDNFRKDTSLLEKAVQQCLESSLFELNHTRQEKLLRAAQYGKTFLKYDQFDHNLMGEICRSLRVVNSLRVEKICRTITHAQLDGLPEPLLIKLLLRYNSHYKAIQICKHLHLSQKLKQQVYIHWACQKIEQQNVSELQLCDEIFEKLQPEHVSYNEVAKKAFKIGKSSLAFKLLEFEKETAKKVPVLLWMAEQDQSGDQAKKYYFENAVKESINSKDSNMINMTLMKVLESQLQDDIKYSILSVDGIITEHTKLYLKNFNKFDILQQYLQSINDTKDLGFLALQQAFQDDLVKNRIEIMKIGGQFLSKSSQFYGNLIKQEVDILNEFAQKNNLLDKNFQQIQNDQQRPFLNETLYEYVKQGRYSEAEKLKEKIGISDKRYHIQIIKVLIEQKEWEKLENYLLQINKKRNVVPFEMVADLIFQVGGHDNIALNLIQNMPDINEQVSILVRIGQPQIAVDACVGARNFTLLREIKDQILDEQVLKNIQLYLNNQVR